MRKEQYLFHQEFSVEQTEMLLGSLDHLPASGDSARRIRERVLQSAAPKAHSRNRIRKTLLPIAACLLDPRRIGAGQHDQLGRRAELACRPCGRDRVVAGADRGDPCGQLTGLQSQHDRQRPARLE